jgi:hypothetical protein
VGCILNPSQFSRKVEGFRNDLNQFSNVAEGRNHILETSACRDSNMKSGLVLWGWHVVETVAEAVVAVGLAVSWRRGTGDCMAMGRAPARWRHMAMWDPMAMGCCRGCRGAGTQVQSRWHGRYGGSGPRGVGGAE